VARAVEARQLFGRRPGERLGGRGVGGRAGVGGVDRGGGDGAKLGGEVLRRGGERLAAWRRLQAAIEELGADEALESLRREIADELLAGDGSGAGDA
jgi:hypothetical protein